MGKPGNKNQSKISNIYDRVPGANDISKDRYTDPEIEGLGSPYDQIQTKGFVKAAKKWASNVYESTIGKVDTKEERTDLWKKGKNFLNETFSEENVAKRIESKGTGGPYKQTSTGVKVSSTEEGTEIIGRTKGGEEVDLTKDDIKANRKLKRAADKKARKEKRNK